MNLCMVLCSFREILTEKNDQFWALSCHYLGDCVRILFQASAFHRLNLKQEFSTGLTIFCYQKHIIDFKEISVKMADFVNQRYRCKV